ncbi:hypothetical protein ACIGW0_31380 [Streptomyces bikiniensis]|uniref:Uncharacterized protein n=1 Tax=Streptomyces bikiniensis TaxID=1896 RepID=A0ABW8D1X4_STRBI
MVVTAGRFYRDTTGDIWQAASTNALLFVAFGDGDPDVEPFDLMPAATVSDEYGPLVEVRPTGWVEN